MGRSSRKLRTLKPKMMMPKQKMLMSIIFINVSKKKKKKKTLKFVKGLNTALKLWEN